MFKLNIVDRNTLFSYIYDQRKAGTQNKTVWTNSLFVMISSPKTGFLLQNMSPQLELSGDQSLYSDEEPEKEVIELIQSQEDCSVEKRPRLV